MKFFLILFSSLALITSVFADRDTSKAQLRQMLKDRQELFDKYSESLSQKSGIFGNKTKNDLRESHARLLEIVDADNKIMSSLNRTLDFRNFEKMNLSFDVSSYEQRIKNLSVLNDTLSKRNLSYASENKALRTKVKRDHLYFAVLILLLVVTTSLVIRNRMRG